MSRPAPAPVDRPARPIGVGPELLLIAAGGACGALARMATSELVAATGGTALLATQIVNLSGAFALGLLLASLETTGPRPRLRTFLAVGVLGSFTTFSTLVADADRWSAASGPASKAASLLSLLPGLFLVLSVALGVAAFGMAGVAYRAIAGPRARRRDGEAA